MKQEFTALYDEQNDILHIAREGYEQEFLEIQPCVSLELDEQRQIIGIEIMRTSMVLGGVIEALRRKMESQD